MVGQALDTLIPSSPLLLMHWDSYTRPYCVFVDVGSGGSVCLVSFILGYVYDVICFVLI